MTFTNTFKFILNATPSICVIILFSVLALNTRSYEDSRESVVVFFEKYECRQRNFPLAPAAADPIDIPNCGLVGTVESRWNHLPLPSVN